MKITIFFLGQLFIISSAFCQIIWKNEYVKNYDSNLIAQKIIELPNGDIVLAGGLDSNFYYNVLNNNGKKIFEYRLTKPGSFYRTIFLGYNKNNSNIDVKNHTMYSEVSTTGFINNLKFSQSKHDLIDSNTILKKGNYLASEPLCIRLKNGNYFFTNKNFNTYKNRNIIDFALSDSNSIFINKDTIMEDRNFYPSAMTETKDSSVLVVCNTFPASILDSDQTIKSLLIKIGKDGKQIWRKYINNVLSPFGISETNDGGILVAAHYYYKTNKINIKLIKLNNTADTKLWEKEIQNKPYNYGSGMLKSNDGGYYVYGFTADSGTGKTSVENGNKFKWNTSSFYISKIDFNGNMKFQENWKDNDSLDCIVLDMIETNDNRVIVFGEQVKNFSRQIGFDLIDESRRYPYIAKLDDLSSVKDDEKKSLNITPNPAQNLIRIGKNSQDKLQILNILSEELNLKITETDIEYIADISDLSNGIYYAVIGKRHCKFVVYR